MLKPFSTLSLAATVTLFAVIAPSQPFFRSSLIAAPAALEVPTSVPDDTSLQVSSGSDAMALITDVLKVDFEGKFDGAAVNVDAVGADQAIQALIDGDSDLAAISRPLTDVERAQDLAAVDVNRIKIAMIVGEDNPFSDSLTSEQFAQIFRGEITDWSEVGGPSGAIRLVDRPDTSDTRLALAPYPVFQAAEFATGGSASQLKTDSPEDIAKELGIDGISYGLISEVENLAGVRILPMHQTLPTDPRYPFSQPFSFVYKGEPSPAVAAFLGYAAGEPGQSALKAANPLAGIASSAGTVVKGATDAAGTVVEGATDAAGTVVKGATDAAGNVVKGATDAAGNVVEGAADVAGNAASQVAAAADSGVSDRNPQSISRANLWWLMLFPAACLGLVFWGARRRNSKTVYATAQGPNVEGGLSSGVAKASAGVAAGTAAAGGAAWAAAQKTGDATKGGFGAVKGGLDNIGDAAKGGLGTVKGGLDNVGDAAKGGLGTVKGGLDNAGDAAKGGLGNIKNAAQQGVGGLKGGLDSAGDVVQGGVSRVGDGIQGGLDSAGNAVQGGTNAVTGQLGEMADGAGNAIQDTASASGSLWNRVRDNVKNAADSVTHKTGELANQAKHEVGNFKDQTGQLGQQGVDKVSDAADNLTDLNG